MKRGGIILVLILGFLLFLVRFSLATQWLNIKDVIHDPSIVRLQQDRKELTQIEKEEIKKYGYTALEIMTYVDDNVEPCQEDLDIFERFIQVDPKGHIRIFDALKKIKYYYKDYLSLLTYEGIKPGGIENKRLILFVNPADLRGSAFLVVRYLRAKDRVKEKEEDGWLWSTALKRIRRRPPLAKGDGVDGSELTEDDLFYRRPWEDTHRILGEDSIGGQECLVIESQNYVYPDYYLSKRISWVDKHNFIDLHEEQFDRDGKLVKIIDKEWHQAQPANYWVRWMLNAVDIKTKHRTIYYFHNLICDQGFGDREFTLVELEKEFAWRKLKNPLPRIKNISDLPPVPRIRGELWDKIGG